MATFGIGSINMDGDTLRCPQCGENYLHHRNTTIFERSEDDKLTTVIAQSEHEAHISKFPSADTCNPSDRRNGIIIEFECEHCHYDYGDASPELTNRFRLAIIQHKGNTFVEWV
jgi:uncharacterized protein (DUF983 family)